MRISPKILIGLLLVNTLGLWILSKDSFASISLVPFRSLSQLMALWAAVLLATNIILSTRLSFLEDWFGGLDKVYKLHQRIGLWAYLAMLYHLIFLLIGSLPNTRVALQYIIPSLENPAWSVGGLALAVFSTLIILTIFLKLPYHIWKLSHIFMGVPLALIVAHVLLINSDISRYVPLKVWIVGYLLLAVIAVVYRRFLYKHLANHGLYTIRKINNLNGIWEFWLRPVLKTLNYWPGQFAFVQFLNPAVGAEKHPFSMASAPGSSEVRLAIKPSGDYTKKLACLKEGDQAKLYGPYGRFPEQYLENDQFQVWVAGGIGITPFLGFFEQESLQPRVQKVWFFYCVKNPAEAVFLEELKQKVAANIRINLSVWYSDSQGPITASTINQITGVAATTAPIFLCAPPPMMAALTKQFVELGVNKGRIIFEDFSLNT